MDLNNLSAAVADILKGNPDPVVLIDFQREISKFNQAAHKVTRGSEAVHVGPFEYRLLCTFMERTGRVYSRQHLLDRVWGRDIYVEERAVDVHVRRLRKALNAGGKADAIRTVCRAGYGLAVAET